MEFFEDGGDLKNGIAEVTTYIEENGSKVQEELIEKCFSRVDLMLRECDFGDVDELVMKLLSALAPIAPMRLLMTSGLYESIFVLFLNKDKTHDQAVVFLDRMFDRPDIGDVFEDIVMVTVVNLANFSPPKLSLWRFMCKFMTKFGEMIEGMVDFTAVESSGMLPIFTRSLVWTYRNIYQHPPEDDGTNEECFWEMWNSILPRYYKDMDKAEPPPVILLFKGLMNEIRLSIYWGLKTTKKQDGTFASRLVKTVWHTLATIYNDKLIEFLETQYPCRSLEIAIELSLEGCTEPLAQRLRVIPIA